DLHAWRRFVRRTLCRVWTALIVHAPAAGQDVARTNPGLSMLPLKPAPAAMAAFTRPATDIFQRNRTTLRVRYWRRLLRDIARPCALLPVPPAGESTQCRLG